MVVSVEQAGEMLGCKRRQVFYLLNQGILERAPRYGRGIRIYLASVQRALLPQTSNGRKRRAPVATTWTMADLNALLAR